MASTQEILKQIDEALELWSTHRAKSKYDDLSDLPDRPLSTEVDTILAATLEPPRSGQLAVPRIDISHHAE